MVKLRAVAIRVECSDGALAAENRRGQDLGGNPAKARLLFGHPVSDSSGPDKVLGGQVRGARL
jgi:hypothetical protein